MRVGLDILSEFAGRSSGTETYLQGFLSALDRVNEGRYTFYLFVNSGNAEFYQGVVPHFEQVRFPFSNRLRPLRVLSQLALIPQRARSLGLDIVNFLGTSGAFGMSCATVQHIKTFHHFEVPETLDRGTVIFRKLMMGLSARVADIVVANSDYTRREIVTRLGVDPQRIVVIPEAVDHSTFNTKVDAEERQTTLTKYGIRKPYLLFVSSLWPYKNVHGLIQAYHLLKKQHEIDHDLIIVGGIRGADYRDRLLRLIEAHDLQESVRFIGHLGDRREIRDLYIEADTFIYPSLSETFGLTLLEAMSCGTPVVASDCTSIPEIAGDAALLVDPEDHGAVSEAIWITLSDSGARQSLIERGLVRAAEYSWEKTAMATLEAYEMAAQRKML